MIIASSYINTNFNEWKKLLQMCNMSLVNVIPEAWRRLSLFPAWFKPGLELRVHCWLGITRKLQTQVAWASASTTEIRFYWLEPPFSKPRKEEHLREVHPLFLNFSNVQMYRSHKIIFPEEYKTSLGSIPLISALSFALWKNWRTLPWHFGGSISWSRFTKRDREHRKRQIKCEFFIQVSISFLLASFN